MKIRQLEYFLEKVCTIFTIPTNRDFKSENPTTFPQPVFHYFVGKVLEIDEKGVTLQQWNNNKKLRSYFFMQHVVGISEEEVLDPNRPEDAKVIEDFKKINENAISKTEKKYDELKKQREIINENPEIDIESLSKLSDKIKQQV
jgi:hypothetical protein